jgi:hypothetical protein
MKRGTRAGVDLAVGASPATLYETVSDIRRTGEWSYEFRPTAGSWASTTANAISSRT